MHQAVLHAACPHDCPDTCSMLVSVEGGRAIAVRGNPDHPFTRGGLCVKVNDYPERVYSPERILHPLRRIGAKGEGSFARIGWADALADIRTRWDGIMAASGPEAILPYSYLGTQGTLQGLNVGDPFFNRLGASISERTFCNSGASTAQIMTIGPTPGTDPESFRHAKLIVIWACNTISTNLHHWPFIAAARADGAKIIVVDPIRSRTAREADWHVPIRPGTDSALALGLINVIFEEDFLDRAYVRDFTLGADELRQRAAEFPPERVAAITGVPADDVRRLAHAYATTQPAAIRVGTAIERHTSGGSAVRAIASLPALVGAWRHVGGGFLQMSVYAFPLKIETWTRPDWIKPGTRVVSQWRLGRALTGELGLDPPIRSLFVYNSNPVIVAPEQEKILEGLAREDLFTVVSEQFLTDTARYADIVLPATTQLEQYDVMYSWGHLYIALNEPAIAPRGEAISNTELFRRLARTFGFDDAFFQRTDEEMAEQAFDWDAPALAGIDLALLKRRGFARLNLPSPDCSAPHAAGNFPTPSGKCEFKSSVAAAGNFVSPGFRQGLAGLLPDEPIDPVPDYQAREPEDRAYPLVVLSPKSHAFINSSFANMPRQLRHAGRQLVRMHPDDARRRRIADGDRVRVFNRRGSLVAVAQVTDDVMRGVIVVPLGHWTSMEGRTAAALNADGFADLGHAPTFSETCAEVVSIADEPGSNTRRAVDGRPGRGGS